MPTIKDLLRLAAEKTNTKNGCATAKALGRNPNTIYQWESGTRAPDVDACVQLAQVTGVPLEEVIKAARDARAKKRKATLIRTILVLLTVALAITSTTTEARTALRGRVDRLCIMLNQWLAGLSGLFLPAASKATAIAPLPT